MGSKPGDFLRSSSLDHLFARDLFSLERLEISRLDILDRPKLLFPFYLLFLLLLLFILFILVVAVVLVVLVVLISLVEL